MDHRVCVFLIGWKVECHGIKTKENEESNEEDEKILLEKRNREKQKLYSQLDDFHRQFIHSS